MISSERDDSLGSLEVSAVAVMGNLRSTMPAKMITYRFFFEGLITEFGNNYRNRIFSLGEPIFESGKKCLKPGFIPWSAVFESGKKYRKLVAESLLSIFIHFLNFLL